MNWEPRVLPRPTATPPTIGTASSSTTAHSRLTASAITCKVSRLSVLTVGCSLSVAGSAEPACCCLPCSSWLSPRAAASDAFAHSRDLPCVLRLASCMSAGDFECSSGSDDQKPYTSDCVSMLNTIHTRIGTGGTEQYEQSGTCQVVITPPSTGPPTSADLWTDVEFIISKCGSGQLTGGSRTLSNGYKVDVNRLPADTAGTPGVPAAPGVNGSPGGGCPAGQACSNVGSTDGCCPGETCRSTTTGTSSCQA